MTQALGYSLKRRNYWSYNNGFIYQIHSWALISYVALARLIYRPYNLRSAPYAQQLIGGHKGSLFMSLGFELLFKLRSAAYECLAPGYQVFL